MPIETIKAKKIRESFEKSLDKDEYELVPVYESIEQKQPTTFRIDTSSLKDNVVRVYADGQLIAEETITEADKKFYESVGYKRPIFERSTSKTSFFKYQNPAELRKLREAAMDDEEFDEEDFGDDEDMEEDDGYRGALSAEHDPAFGYDGEEVPTEFQFASNVIFISNLLTVPQPLLDRCFSVGIILTKEEIIEKIEGLVERIEPVDMPVEDKMEVVKFLRRMVLAEKRGSMKITKDLTFRAFMMVCGMKTVNPNGWQQMAVQNFSGKQKSFLR